MPIYTLLVVPFFEITILFLDVHCNEQYSAGQSSNPKIV